MELASLAQENAALKALLALSQSVLAEYRPLVRQHQARSVENQKFSFCQRVSI